MAAILKLQESMKRHRLLKRSLGPFVLAAALLGLSSCTELRPVPPGARTSPPPAGPRRVTLSDVLDRQAAAALARQDARLGGPVGDFPRLGTTPPP
jgi:hypothetical protein